MHHHYPCFRTLTSRFRFHLLDDCISTTSTSSFTTTTTTTTTTVSKNTMNSTNSNNTLNHQAFILDTSIPSIARAAERIQQGSLVSFPTETVYGLGCNALDPTAIEKVFRAKERPLTDPLILHVYPPTDAWSLWQAFHTPTTTTGEEYENYNNRIPTSYEKQVLTILTQAFWPGPLTLVAKAASHIPSIVMANTGYVACRSPSHPIAQSLIQQAHVPIAAPSANKFGHVSPTIAQHVWDDLHMEDVWILDPLLHLNTTTATLHENQQKIQQQQDEEDMNDQVSIVCNVGVESTVAKIEMYHNNNNSNNNKDNTSYVGRILILRHGAISAQDIQRCLYLTQLDTSFEVLDNMMQSTKNDVHHVAPGQCIKHYSPNVPSFMMDTRNLLSSLLQKEDGGGFIIVLDEEDRKRLQSSVIIDFGSQLVMFKEYVLAYRDLSIHGDAVLASSRVFSLLRWSEQVSGAQQVLFPRFSLSSDKDSKNHKNNNPQPLLQALIDRLTRAASGNVISSLKELKNVDMNGSI